MLKPRRFTKGKLGGEMVVAILAYVSSGRGISGLYIAYVSKASCQTHTADLI